MPPRTLSEFLESKAQSARPSGFDLSSVPEMLMPFQAALLRWAAYMGRGLLMADCGTGKTPIQLYLAEAVAKKENGRALILTPLAVGPQFVAEAEKFNVDGVARSKDGAPAGRITITNYESLKKFDPADYVFVSCDESSILKNFSGVRRKEITEFLRQIPYRLLATATAAPNDYKELGTSSEALGHMGYVDMVSRYFINDEHSLYPTALGARWRFKKAAEVPYWRWVCSWAKAIRKPSDLGDYSDAGFELPPLTVRHREVENVDSPEGFLPGVVVEARTLREQRDERRRNIRERCDLARSLATDHDRPVVIWTDYNAEADLMESMIPGAKQVSGSMDDHQKERVFSDFAAGDLRVLITKPKIGAWGMNWQHCSDVIFFVSHSFEQYYQAIRRCWRYGQTRPVTVDVVATPGERRIVQSLERKSRQAERMYAQLVRQMAGAENHEDEPALTMEVPKWLT